jgi:hypothetical protein
MLKFGAYNWICIVNFHFFNNGTIGGIVNSIGFNQKICKLWKKNPYVIFWQKSLAYKRLCNY